MAHRHFEGALHAQLYGKYRPIPPARLIQRVVNYLKEQHSGPLDTCYDVGCGTGQSTGFFSDHFRTVVGTDISAEQIRNAEKLNRFPNVRFIVSPAEQFSELKNNSIELVTACQAAHWFNLPNFYKEANRVLQNKGVLSLYGYEFPCFVTGDEEKDRKLNYRLQHLYKTELKDFVHSGSIEVYIEKYTNPKYQFGSCRTDPTNSDSDNSNNDSKSEITSKTGVAGGADGDSSGSQEKLLFTDFTREEGFFEDCESSLEDMVNYCLTWSGYQNYLKVHGEEKGAALIKNLEKDLLEILDAGSQPEDIKFLKRTKFFLLMGRK